MKSILEYKTALTLVGATMTAISGACWGYVFAANEAEAEIDARVETVLKAEVERVRLFYQLRYKDFGPEELSDLTDADIEGGKASVVASSTQITIPAEAFATEEGKAAVLNGVKSLLEAESQPAAPPPTDDLPVEVNSWEESPHYDEVALRAIRNPDKPYIVSPSEYAESDGYEEYKLTWFETDGILMGEDEDTIPDTDTVVGDDNLSKFGAMSGNNNLVYVRNETSRCVFAITRVFGSASAFLYGGDDAEPDTVIAHSSMAPRRPRRDRDN